MPQVIFIFDLRRAARLLAYCLFCLFLVPMAEMHAADRFALVIGNGGYKSVPSLANPTRDATAVSQSLTRLDFSVTTILDADAVQMRRALIEFGRVARGSEMAVVFFAGHGIEVGGENWLIPVDAELINDTDTENEAISLKSVTLQASKARQLGLVILDACRNNPFAATMQRSIRTRAVQRGLAATEPTDNVLVAYAAKDGTTASDGNGLNSPFTTALLKNLEVPGLEISFLFRNVRDEVMDLTNRVQQPFVYGSLSREAVYLRQPEPNSAGTVTEQPLHDEIVWSAIKDSTSSALFEDFLKRYPSSSKAETAKRALDRSRLVSTSPASSQNVVAKANPFFLEADAKNIANVATRYKLTMPHFEIKSVDETTSDSRRKFLGIWASKVGYGGSGRQAMIIVESVSPSGQISGYYIWGPPTGTSFSKWPSGYYHFSTEIMGAEYRIKRGTVVHTVGFVGDKNILRIADQHVDGKTADIQLEPLWILAKK